MNSSATRTLGKFEEVSGAGWFRSQKLGCLLTVFILLSSVCPVFAQDQPLRQLYHTAWTFRDDAPISSDLIQTPDGFLWLGGTNGLYRYDGIRFERFSPKKGPPLPTTAIFSVDLGIDGSLWIGWRLRGLSRLKDGVLTNYGEESGLPNSTVNGVTQDGKGRLWAATILGLYRKVDDRWIPLGKDLGYQGGSHVFTFADKEGVLWVADENAVHFLSPVDGLFHTAITNTNIVSITEQPNGTMWGLSDKGVMTELLRGNVPHQTWKIPVKTVAYKALFDRTGDLWIATTDKGVLRITGFPQVSTAGGNPHIEGLSRQEGGLSGDMVYQLFEDREGNMWTATSRGLDRLRKSAFNEFPIQNAKTDGGSVLSGDNGNVYILPFGMPAIQFPQTLKTTLSSPFPVDIRTSYRSPSGVAWFGGLNFLWRRDGDTFKQFPLPIPKMGVESMVSDGADGLWVTFPVRNGFFHFHNGVWTTSGINPSLPTRSARTAMIDKEKRIWFGYSSSSIAVLEPSGRVQLFSKDDNETIGTVTAMNTRIDHIWVGGDNGLRRFVNGHFEQITNEDGQQFFGVTGIVETQDGDLWLNEALDVIKIPSTELNNATTGTSVKVRSQRYDVLDGLTGGSSNFAVGPTIAEGDHGKIWFALENAIGWIDPEHIPHNMIPPPVSIEVVTADGAHYTEFRNLKLPVNPKDIQIDYTAPSLTIPQRVRFRYRLDGVDTVWQDAGTRRQAFYTKLTPGTYRFQVIAANNDGLWNNVGASISFEIPPTLVQTLWFRVLLLLVGLSAIWIAFVWRFRSVTARFKSDLSQRMVERERIARELHDTLLQGFQGLVLKFQTAARKIPHADPARAMMEDALDRADEILVEGRNRVRDLRAEEDTFEELSVALASFVEELQKNYSAKFALSIKGDGRQLHPVVRDEAFWIGREALLNAFMHADATKVECDLSFEPDRFILAIRDDGKGIDTQVIKFGRTGHWGLAGMRERAHSIQGDLGVWSRFGAGTEITLKIPAGLAYQDKSSSAKRSVMPWNRLRRGNPHVGNRED